MKDKIGITLVILIILDLILTFWAGMINSTVGAVAFVIILLVMVLVLPGSGERNKKEE